MTARLQDALEEFSKAAEQCIIHLAKDGVCPAITLETLLRSRSELHDAIQHEPISEKGSQ